MLKIRDTDSAAQKNIFSRTAHSWIDYEPPSPLLLLPQMSSAGQQPIGSNAWL